MVADLRYFNSLELENLKAQLQDTGIVIRELKKLIEKLKEKSVDTKFEKSSVIRQPNAFKSQRPSVLGKSNTFSNSFVRKDFSKSTSVTQTNVSNDFSKPVTAQTLPSNKKFILKNTNVLPPGMYKIHTNHNQTRTSQLPQNFRKTNTGVSFSTGVIPTTSVSRPQLKSNPRGDRVLRNSSQGKKQEVEDQRRNVKLSKNKTSVTACNDSLNAKTLNVKSVSAMCDKYVLINKHNMCVLNSIAKPIKRTVASESNKKPRNFTRKLYERVSKTCSWWYSKFTPSGYKWKPKSRKENVNPNKFLGTVKFGNDQIAPILGYGDLVQGAITIKRKSMCFIRDLNGNDLLTGSRGTDLYLITLQNTNSPNPICLMAKATSSQAWLWHRRLYTWTYFLRFKDETPEVLINFLRLVQKGLQSQVRVVRTDKGTEFLNQTLHAYFAAEGILHQTSVARTPEQNSSMALNHDSLSPAIQCQANVPQEDRTFTRSKELDFLFSLMFDELLNGSSKVVSKSSAVFAADAPNQRQHHTTPLNNHTTPTPTYDEFINIFSTPVQDQGETSSRHIDSSNMHTFYQRDKRSSTRASHWKSFTEAMADSAWIELMQEELHQFNRLDVWELVDRPLCTNVINLKWLWKNKRDEENTVIQNKSRLVAKGYA
nr:Gag-Pol polyprotein [Tanacetum cinerariifolium]